MLSILKTILPHIIRAGEEVLKIYSTEFQVTYKSKDDPLTQADLKAHEIISKAIQKYFPEDYILSEEDASLNQNQTKKNIWLLDPIDGTREFVKKNNQFAISLGYSVSGKPTLGIILNPSTDELILGTIETGISYTSFKNPDLTNWSRPLLSPPSMDRPICLVSNTEYSENLFQSQIFTSELNLKPMGSIAYKLGLVAAGKGDICISLKPKSDWDIGAGVALIKSSGGTSHPILSREEFNFHLESIRKEGIIAGNISFINLFYDRYHKELKESYRFKH